VRFGTHTLDTGQLLRVLKAVKQGDFSARMPLDRTGIAWKIADALNDVIELNETLCAELARISAVVGKEGQTTQRASIGGAEGSWAKGRESAGEIVLTGTNTAALENLKITSDSTWVSARLGTSLAVWLLGSTGGAKERTKTLQVHLAAGAPPGVFESHVSISLANGQRLVVPVAAYVKP
jgi:hypothetical protein